MSTKFTSDDVAHVAALAHIPVTGAEKDSLAAGFTAVISVLDQLKSLDVDDVEQTNQVTGFTNVLREDKIDEARMFTQEEALANAPRKHAGYFVSDQVIDSDV